MDHSMPFSLIDEPWIRCRRIDGTETALSLREAFDGSQSVAEIRGESPTQDYAVLRVLLAVFWRAHRHEAVVGPGETFDIQDWHEEAWNSATTGGPDAAVLDYLEQHRDRFDLLHPTQPFMQVATLHTSKDTRFPIGRIIPEAESGYFTMRAGAGLDSLSFAEAARWLLHTQAYDYSGIKSGAVGDPRVKGGRGYPIGTGWSGMTGGTTILGDTLRQTLVLNTVQDALLREEDHPVWERDPDGPAERTASYPAGAADLATWQSRRVRLFVTDGLVTEVLVSNGDRIPEAGANIFGDPMTPYRFSSNKSTASKTVHYPRPYDTSRMMWKSLEPLIALDGDVALTRGEKSGFRPRTLDLLAEARAAHLADSQQIISLRLTSASYGPQASSAATTVDARLDIPRRLLGGEARLIRRAVLDTAKTTLAAGVLLGTFGGRLLVAAGGEYAFRAAATDALLAELEPDFRAWLRTLDLETADEAMVRWQQHVADRIRERATELLRGAGPKALIGREVVLNERTSLLTAGTAYYQLLRDLRKTLPLLPSPVSDPRPPQSTPSTEPTKELSTDD